MAVRRSRALGISTYVLVVTLVCVFNVIFISTVQVFFKHIKSGPDYKVNGDAVRWQYDILPNSCREFSDSIWLVIAVISKPDGFEQRQAIRQTWGSWVKSDCGVRLVFVLGRIHDTVKQRDLVVEDQTYGDILQSNQFDDTYRASSLKTLSLFQWCAGFCAESVYLLRIDDDMWLTVPRLTDFLVHHTNGSTLVGVPLPTNSTLKVERDPFYKYYVPREEYPHDVYPHYFSGALFAVPTKYLAKLIHASQTRNTVFLDDVYVGGILRPVVNLSLTPMPNYDVYGNIRRRSCRHAGKMSIHRVRQEHLYAMWQNRKCLNLTETCQRPRVL